MSFENRKLLPRDNIIGVCSAATTAWRLSLALLVSAKASL